MTPPVDWSDPYTIKWLDREIDKRIELKEQAKESKDMKARNEQLILGLGIVICLGISAVLWVLH